MTEDELTVETTGETVGEAKWAAVRELQRLAPGLDRDAVRFQVVDEGERGLLGVGTTPARVVASVAAPEPADPSTVVAEAALPTTDVEVAEGIVRHALAALDLDGTIELSEHDDELLATVSGTDAGILIGRHGQMLEALQVLANAVAHARLGDGRRRIVIDAAGYRERRRETLEGLARTTAERAVASGQPIALEPMSASERRIVHEALKDDPEVETASDGDEPHRCVVVRPTHAAV
jgi:spoIIIJ-associated protein